jgi:spermidine/putrescine transport system permease protein
VTGRVPPALLAFTGAVYLFLHLPIAVLVAFSFNDSKFSAHWVGFTLAWYRRLLERQDILDGLQASLIVGGIATAVSAVLGTGIAHARGRHRVRGRTQHHGLL